MSKQATLTREVPGWYLTQGTHAAIIYAETRDDALTIAAKRWRLARLDMQPDYIERIRYRPAPPDDIERLNTLGQYVGDTE